MDSSPYRPLRTCAAVGRTGAGGAADWAIAVKSCLDQLGPIPSSGLGFLYFSDALAPHAGSIATLVRQLTGIDDWVGAASDAVMAVGPRGPEVLGPEVPVDGAGSGPGVAMMILALPADSHRLIKLSPESSGGTPEPGLHDWMQSAGKPFAVFHADQPSRAAVQAAGSLRAVCRDIPGSAEPLGLVGAVLGGGTGPGGARPQVCGVVADGGVTGVVLAGAACGISGLAQGCAPIGPVRWVSDADGGVVSGLDGHSARAAFHQDIGDLLARDPQRTQGFVFAGLIRGRNGSPAGRACNGQVIEPGDYAVASIVDPGGWPGGCQDAIRLTTDPAPGDGIVFVRRDQASAIAALDRMVDRLIRRAGRAHIRAAHLITCGDRATSIFGNPGIDFMRIADRLGPVPMIGFQADTPIMGETLYSRAAVLTLWTDNS